MSALPATEPLQRYLRVLWGIAPEIRLDAEVPSIQHGVLRLPAGGSLDACEAWRRQRAAAAHAGAHRVYSPPGFDGAGLGPLVRALVGVLEDARVEALAGRELPGLRRLWASLHGASPADGESVPALLARLARALADPDYADPHPWIAKGRALFFADDAGEVLALGDPARLRQVASRLGNDLGQMRLQFNAKSWRPAPAYRDDNAWMWPAELAADEAPREPPPAARDTPAAGPVPPQPPVEHLPEWDRLIGRLRRDWVAVFEQEAVPAAEPLALEGTALRQATRRALLAGTPTQRRGLDETGPSFDPDALVRVRIAQRLRHAVDPRVHPRRVRPPRPGRVLLLVDRSASSGDTLPGSAGTVLDVSLRAAALLAEALAAHGRPAALLAFASEGRAALRLAPLQRAGQPTDAAGLRRRLAGLQPGGSTRLGAVLRSALKRLGRAGADEAPPVLLLIGDGRPHDIDVHDPRYLGADCRHALAQARRQGVRVLGLIVDPADDGSARRLFGAGAVALLPRLEQLPRTMARLRL
jgi:nitric oxide reductase NorD protein